MRNKTKNLQNFIAYVFAYENLTLSESPCANTGYKVFPSGEVYFRNVRFQELSELHDDAWLAALDSQEL